MGIVRFNVPLDTSSSHKNMKPLGSTTELTTNSSDQQRMLQCHITSRRLQSFQPVYVASAITNVQTCTLHKVINPSYYLPTFVNLCKQLVYLLHFSILQQFANLGFLKSVTTYAYKILIAITINCYYYS